MYIRLFWFWWLWPLASSPWRPRIKKPLSNTSASMDSIHRGNCTDLMPSTAFLLSKTLEINAFGLFRKPSLTLITPMVVFLISVPSLLLPPPNPPRARTTLTLMSYKKVLWAMSTFHPKMLFVTMQWEQYIFVWNFFIIPQILI